MSQEKVDFHKEQKRNRRKIMRKEKAMRRLEITVLIVVLAALIGWFSYLVYRNIQSKNGAANVNATEMHLSAWEEFTQNLNTLINGEEAEAETADGEADAEAEEAEVTAASTETAVSEGTAASTETAVSEVSAASTEAAESEAEKAESTESTASEASSESTKATSEK